MTCMTCRSRDVNVVRRGRRDMHDICRSRDVNVARRGRCDMHDL